MAKTSQQKQKTNATEKKNVINNNKLQVNNNHAAATKVKRTRKSIPRESPPKRSSIYRGITRHRWTGRFEAHLWDKSCWNELQNKKGKQVYLGGYDDEDAAGRAYDLAALKYRGLETILNFEVSRRDQRNGRPIFAKRRCQVWCAIPGMI